MRAPAQPREKDEVDGRVLLDGGEGARGGVLAGPGAGGDPEIFVAVGPELHRANGGRFPSADDGFEFAGHGGDESGAGHEGSAGCRGPV